MNTDTLFLQVGLLVAINVGILAAALVSAWRDTGRRAVSSGRQAAPADHGLELRRQVIHQQPACGRQALLAGKDQMDGGFFRLPFRQDTDQPPLADRGRHHFDGQEGDALARKPLPAPD